MSLKKPRSKKGLFITLEGGEGAGKSTLSSYIDEVLTEAAWDVVLTREPGGTESGDQIRKILLGGRYTGLSDETELLLLFSARSQHIKEIIAPALSAGKAVVCDRFTDSSYAYQGGGRGITAERIRQLENWMEWRRKPDLTLLFDLDVEAGLRRIDRRGGHADRFEQETPAFFKRVRACYLERAHNEPERFVIIDAAKPVEVVKQQIADILKDKKLC